MGAVTDDQCVFVVWHTVENNTAYAKLVAAYSSEQRAKARIERIRRLPGLAQDTHEFLVTRLPGRPRLVAGDNAAQRKGCPGLDESP